MEWIKQTAIVTNGNEAPKVQYHQPIWNDGTEMPAQVSESLTTGNDFPNYALYLTVGSEENARVVFAGRYYSLDQIEEFLVDWAAQQIALTPEIQELNRQIAGEVMYRHIIPAANELDLRVTAIAGTIIADWNERERNGLQVPYLPPK